MIYNQVAAGAAPQPAGRDAPGPEHSLVVTPRGQSPVPAALLLAVIPLVLFGGPAAVSAPPPPLPIKQVQTESIRVIRMDATTFRGRWMPINDMPPATVIHEVQLKGGDALSQELTGKPVVAAAKPSPPAARIVRGASLRPTDVCARHGLRRVTYSVRGYQHWRCRR